jgi:maltooligosyltrehalose trehalohydrolase
MHHALHVLLTGECSGFFIDYAHEPERHLGRALTEGFAYQGERSAYRENAPRGEPSGELPPGAFVTFLQNHDQVGNRPHGERLGALTDESKLRAATVAWLLSPSTPMLFMGEEFAAATPFMFFCEFEPDLAGKVVEGRAREFAELSAGKPMPDPGAESTFIASKLDWASLENPRHVEFLTFYKDLLAIRRRRLVPHFAHARGLKYELLGEGALIASWRLGDGGELALRLNLSENAVRAAPPEGELLCCEPRSASDATQAGQLPAVSAAWYLKSGAGKAA